LTNSNLSQPDFRKQVKSEGNGVPQWLLDLGIGPGEFYLDAKPRPRAAMKCAGWTGEMGRVYSCLSLHTMAFGSEVAVKLERGKLVPITPKDISHETGGMDRRQVRRALAALEAGGFIERSGETIRCWASPRAGLELPPVENEKTQGMQYPSDLPDYLLHYLRRFRPANLPDAAQLEELKPLCSSAAELETKIRHILKPDIEAEGRTRAPGRKQSASGHARSSDRTRASASSASVVVKNTGKVEIQNEIQTAHDVLLERTERKKTSSSSSRNGTNKKPMMMTPELEQISQTVRQFCLPERSAVDLMIRSCHAAYPNVTAAMICEAVELKGPMAVRKDNPIGFLTVAVPNVLTGVRASAAECTCGHRGQCAWCHSVR
jgi:hypothetical protein